MKNPHRLVDAVVAPFTTRGDMLGPSGTTGRSIVITYTRELEAERTRLESLVAES